MVTITISDETYRQLAQKAKLVNSVPDAVAEELLQSCLEMEAHLPPIRTLGDLLTYGYGLWADRSDLEETTDYAARLRDEAWQRNP
jgi:hypothetical protein